jgi:hypothetical protein
MRPDQSMTLPSVGAVFHGATETIRSPSMVISWSLRTLPCRVSTSLPAWT